MSIKKLRPMRWLDLSSPYVCHIFNGDRPSVLFEAEGDPAPTGGDPAPTGDTPPAAKTHTQADIDAAAAKIRQDERKKYQDYDTLKATAAKLPELEAKLQEMQTQFEESKLSADEKQRKAAERAAKQIETERAELQNKVKEAETQAETYKNKHINGMISRSLASALATANVLTAAQADAVALMQSSAKIDHDDDGNITLIELNGVAHLDVGAAALAFLKSKPHLVSGGKPPSGGGTKPPNAGGGTDMANLPADQLIGNGIRQRQTRI
jgi:hypothetical protein